MVNKVFLGVNIDHVATVRQARGTQYPDVLAAALLAEQSGADSITLHLREDRRHIQDQDVWDLKDQLTTKMNLEMAVTDEMVNIACAVKPEDCCIVPEKRQELTTEGGLDVLGQLGRISEVITELHQNGIKVSPFIDADFTQIEATAKAGAKVCEIHTGHYADAKTKEQQQKEWYRIKTAVEFAHSLGLQVNTGHGLHYLNVQAIAKLPNVVELNIGHAIIAKAVFVGLAEAVSQMKNLILNSSPLDF